MRDHIIISIARNARWEPVDADHPSAVGTMRWRAFRSDFVVWSASGVPFTGEWRTEQDAERFADSLPRLPGIHAHVQRVEPYLYAHRFGPVEL